MNRTLAWGAALVAAWYVFLRPQPAPPAQLPVYTSGEPPTPGATITAANGQRYVFLSSSPAGTWTVRPYAAPGMMAPAVVYQFDPAAQAIVNTSIGLA